MIKSILFIHDDSRVGILWTGLLRQKDWNVVSAELGQDLAEPLQEQAFDLIIVNISALRPQGIETCHRLRDLFVNPILLMASGRDEDYILQAYAAGIDEYIPTSIDPRVFLAIVNVWLRHTWTISTAALDNIQLSKIRLDTERRAVVLPNQMPLKLTNLEFRVLHLLMTHPDKTLDAHFIIERVWGYSSSDESILLKNVIYRLRRKIEPDPTQPVHIATVPGMGYAFHAERSVSK